MSRYTIDGGRASRPFIISPYSPTSSGQLVPQIPDTCIFAGDGRAACWVIKSHWRPRKTGPMHPVLVCRCTVHGCAFTLYPPGQFPYGWAPVARVAPDGSLVDDADRDGTVFEAAVDADNDTAWPRSAPGGTDWWWSHQGRLLGLGLRLLGLSDDIDQDLRHRIMQELGIQMLTANEALATIEAAPGYRSRGTAIVRLLNRIAGGVVRALMATGFLAGLWGPPLWWDGVLRPLCRGKGKEPP